ncbi:50S ribosomal protein L22 [Candidatus Peregrinibacteria bacterium RIFCSPLOWO2_02_FULL_48_14]|nr:MAG: 50S ribosomal protein L22 [Candidatus Peregrinibacteria bacterium RIFCSPLOWO2_01_FULL_48_20]OGJ43589.1 MAG: 50S ribosomal protein L22 [Candidatus Peregrinibacteria bacterium RIFCSPLOWO2_02_FULL_48_14]
MKALLKNTRISPKKANLVAGLVRGTMAEDALNQLKFTPKKGAKILYKVIDSAVANAENNLKQNRKNLYIKEIVVTKGPTYKRGISVSKGRVHPILKRTAQIRVLVDLKPIQ